MTPERPESAEPPGAAAIRPGWRRYRRAGALIAVCCALLGFGLAVQVRSTQATISPAARQEDLVLILDDLSAREDRLRAEISNLQAARASIGNGTGRTAAALQEARQRAEELGVLAGTVPAYGPGLILTVSQGSKHLPAELLLDALEELRGAGTEAVQLAGTGGGAVRVGASTWFTDTADGVRVDGTSLHPPYEFRAIGDPATMSAALNIPGGVTDTVRQAGGSLTIGQPGQVNVTALRPVVTPAYARPAK